LHADIGTLQGNALFSLLVMETVRLQDLILIPVGRTSLRMHSP